MTSRSLLRRTLWRLPPEHRDVFFPKGQEAKTLGWGLEDLHLSSASALLCTCVNHTAFLFPKPFLCWHMGCGPQQWALEAGCPYPEWWETSATSQVRERQEAGGFLLQDWRGLLALKLMGLRWKKEWGCKKEYNVAERIVNGLVHNHLKWSVPGKLQIMIANNKISVKWVASCTLFPVRASGILL